MGLDLSEVQKLVGKRGWNAISKALMNQVIWNKKDEPGISKWAKRMQKRLSKWVEKQRVSDPTFGKI